MYGEEDGTPRHVSERVVRLIVRTFMEFYGATPGPAESAPIREAAVAARLSGSA